MEVVASYEDCAALTQAIKAVPEVYQPSDQVGALPAYLPSGLKQFRALDIGAILSKYFCLYCFRTISN